MGFKGLPFLVATTNVMDTDTSLYNLEVNAIVEMRMVRHQSIKKDQMKSVVVLMVKEDFGGTRFMRHVVTKSKHDSPKKFKIDKQTIDR